MKKSLYFLILAACLLFSAANAQNQIALQHNGATTLFTTIPDAVAAAVSGDTIYLPGGSFPGFNIDKTLAVIGVGHHPDSTVATGMTFISGTIGLNSGDCDGSLFAGLRINGGINVNVVDNDYVQISRCFLSSGISIGDGSENWTISECILSHISSINNSFVGNNLFYVQVSNAQNCQISNNIFLNPSNSAITGDFCTVNNNIFYYSSLSSIDNSLFNNNIWSSGSQLNGILANGNIGTGNVNDPNFDALFNNFSYAAYGGNLDSLYQFDFHLANPAYNTGGTDGTPIGIYGGTFPWKDGSIPFNPQILFQNIESATDQNGNLLINIHVKAQDQ